MRGGADLRRAQARAREKRSAPVRIGAPRQPAGFTLIEVIVTLVLMGILAALAGTGIVAGVKGYALTRDATREAQVARIAMARISRELMELLSVDTSAYAPPVSSAVRYERLDGFRRLGLDDGKVKLAQVAVPLAQGDTLIDGVSAFTLSFFKEYRSDSSNTAWDGSEIRELSLIMAELKIAAKTSGMAEQTLKTFIHMRNNRNRGGE